MKIDLYHIHKHLHFTNFAYPIILDVLKTWAESIGWEAHVSVCKESGVDLSTDADVVGISVYTMTAPAAFRLCEKLRRKEKVVILGGPHFRGTDTCGEASAYCDVIVNSICEDRWKNLLQGIANGEILPNRKRVLYIVDKKREFRYPNNFYETFQSQKWYHMSSVPTSLGCPYKCDFCSPYMQGDYILRNIETIYNEVLNANGRSIFLCDSTFGLNKRFTIQLMERLAPLEKKIVVETTLARLNDEDIPDALASGGVKWIIVGIETLALKLKKHGSVDLEDGLKRLIDRVHKRGMLIQGNMICGMDCDGPESFERVYNFIKRSELDSIMIDILTPFPNTKIYHQFQKQGRIFDTNWEHYDYHHLIYRPLRMSADQLINGFIDLYKSLSRTSLLINEAIRVWRDRGLNIESAGSIGFNLYNWRDARKKEKELKKNLMHIKGNYSADLLSAYIPDKSHLEPGG